MLCIFFTAEDPCAINRRYGAQLHVIANTMCTLVLRQSSLMPAYRLTTQPTRMPVRFVSIQVLASNKRSTDADTAEAFAIATQRLQTLLTDASLSNKDVVPLDHLDACNAEERLTVFTNLGSLTMLIAIALCWLFGEDDPLGGIRMSADTLDAAATGVAYAMPLLLCSVLGRSDWFKHEFPVLEELHDSQQGLARHLINGMNMPQVGILLAFLVLPSLMLLLPTTRAAIYWAGHFMHQTLLQPWGTVLHVGSFHLHPLAAVLAPLLSGYLAGLCSSLCFSVRPKQIEVVRDSLKNADRYFSVTVVQYTPSTRGPAAQDVLPSVFASSSELSSTPTNTLDGDGQQPGPQLVTRSNGRLVAEAFKAVTLAWFLSRRRVARLAYVLTMLDVAYLGVLWQMTNDLATPVAAAFVLAAAECWLGEQQHHRKTSTDDMQAPTL